MKKLIALCTMFGIVLLNSCGKDKEVSDEELLNKKIEEIVPKQYLDSLKKIGLEIYTGTTPPKVQGVYAIQPHILIKSNFNDSYAPGFEFRNAVMKLYDQSSEDFSIKMIARDFLKERDTSVVTAISGSGNKFTIYGKTKAYNNYNKFAVFAMIISGTMEGENIKDLRTGLINIDNSNGASDFINEGEGRLTHDSDKISERVSETALGYNKNKSIQTSTALDKMINAEN